MKHVTTLLAGAALIVTAASCQSPSKLAKEVEGSWAGVPERLFDADASSATVIETFSFAPSDSAGSADGGRLYLSALISVTAALPGTPGVMTPVSVTASGYATIEGTWSAVAADKIDVSLDPSTLTVKVDPDDVLVSTDMLEDRDSASLSSTRPQLASSIRAQLQKVMSERYRPNMELTGVSVSDAGTLRFKIDKSTYTLSRQPSL